MSEPILGISSFYHDSAAALIIDGEIIAAAQEERFTRIKNDSSFPKNAIQYVLSEAGINLKEIKQIVFYEKPFIRFERLLETYHVFAPKGIISFLKAIPIWSKEKIFFKRLLRNELSKIGISGYRIYFSEHHISHAASAFYPSPFRNAAILTLDGVGEWTTTAICKGEDNKIRMIRELHFPHSLGLFYSAFTAFCGFKVNSGEYKLMGLAPYGDNSSDNYWFFKEAILSKIIDIRTDGSFLLNMQYFEFATGLQMFNTKKWRILFGIDPSPLNAVQTQVYADLALAVQHIVEDIILKLAETAQILTQAENLVLSGGVALNGVVNGKLLKSNLFKNIWIQPAAGDAGGAVGAALCLYHFSSNKHRFVSLKDGMKNSLLGPSFTNNQVQAVLKKNKAVFADYQGKEKELINKVARLLSEGKVVGCFKGRMEYGPRALGARSILANPCQQEMQQVLNKSIKKRESFRPFAPIVLEEDVSEFFDIDRNSPYMQFVVPVKNKEERCLPEGFSKWTMRDKLSFPKGMLPAVTHVDYSARLQTVTSEQNSFLYSLLTEFKLTTGVGVLINTSFNERGEPIVCTPDDAFKSFMRTEMDILVIEDFLLFKHQQIRTKKEFEISFNSD